MGSDRYMESKLQSQDNFWPAMGRLKRLLLMVTSKELSDSELKEVNEINEWYKSQAER